jgi:mRNA interferase MazF
MTNYRKGDLLLVAFPFTDVGQSKRRPAMVIADTGDSDVLLARVTTQNTRGSFDVELADWQAARLLAPSVVRLHKLATIKKSLVERPLGTLTDADRKSVGRVLEQLSSGW